MKTKLNKSKQQTKGNSNAQVNEAPVDAGNFDRIKARLQELEAHQRSFENSLEGDKDLHHKRTPKLDFNDTIVENVSTVDQEQTLEEAPHAMSNNSYTDLSKAPGTLAAEKTGFSLEESLNEEINVEFDRQDLPSLSAKETPVHFDPPRQEPASEQRRVPHLSLDHLEASKPAKDSEYTSNVKTLIKLVNELPEGVTKQTGAQIIRLTMEAMGIIMEDVLSEAQGAQSEMLEAVRGNIKKIEEYKTVIRKLESDIKYYQGRANELSEIIDLFILSSTTKHSQDMA